MKLGFLLISLCVSTIPGNDASERCDDWGVVTTKRIHAYDGEPARIRCPLFEDFLKHNYSTAHSAGLTLMWYWTGQGKDLEEPINIRLPDNRISKEKDTLWFRPALVNDTGNYTCMLRNTTYCSRIAFPWEVLQKDPGSCVSQAEKSDVVEFPLQHIGKLPCPDTEGYFPANVTPTVKWYMNCNLVDGFNERHPKGLILIFTTVRLHYEGNYTCIVTYEENGRQYNLTRTSPVKVIGAPEDEKPPTIVIPSDKTTYEFAAGEDLHLSCQVEFSFVKGSRNDIWWTVDGKNAEENTDPKMNVTTSVIDDIAGAKTIRKDLSIQHITAEQLMQNYTCSARNRLGALSRQARVKLKVGTPRYITELACGFGVTVFLVVCLIVVYHVYWLEMVLFYRAHFGTDETIGDGKEYDVYVSYARNAEEEEFVLVTLRGVLENEFGYKLCIFDRDSLPGGIITDETLSFIKKSRRLLVLISPSYVLQGTQALLELKAGLENMASQGSIRVILVQYKAIKSREKVKELKRAQAVLSVIKWKGEKSRFPGGRFWKQLHVALPVKHSCPTSARTNDTMEAVFDFIQRSRRMIVILSPDYLTDKSISMLEFKLGMVCQNAICTSLIIVEYKSLQGTHSTISKLKETIPFVRWEGESSRRNSSKFWKALRLALPLRSLTITTRSSWNESCSSQSDLSLDQIQKKKRRLKGTMATPSSKANPKDKNMAAGTEKAKNGPKDAKACQCCVTYCDSEHRLRSKCRAGAKPKWETRLCKPTTYGNKTHWVQNGITQQAPATPPVTAFTLQQYTDLSNNNSDFYVL